MVYEFTGKVHQVCDVQTFASGFSKRELIVEESGERQHPNHVTFNFKKDYIAKLDDVHAGDVVTVGFALDGRSWMDPRTNKERHFSDLVGLSVKVDTPADDKAFVAPNADIPADGDEEYPF